MRTRRGTTPVVQELVNEAIDVIESSYDDSFIPKKKVEVKPTGKHCSICGEPQFNTPSGVSCKTAGHGGASAMEDAPKLVSTGDVLHTIKTIQAERTVTDTPQPDGPNVFPSGDEGESVTVTFGEMTFTPEPYQSFRVGPFGPVTTRVRKGENINDAARRVLNQLRQLAVEQYALKSDLHSQLRNKR